MRLIPLMLLLLACDGELPAETELSWFSTCGDPACSGYSGPFAGVEACTDETEGAPCTEDGAQCDPVSDCNARFVCAAEDPKLGEGGCPISLRKYKHDIRYLNAAEIEALRQATVDLPLATWRYNGAAPSTPPRLGFIIDDRPTSPAVAPGGAQVDVYGLASMAIAALQAQERELAALRAQQASLEARLKELEARR